MSYSSKRTIASIIAGLILIAAYAIYALGTAAPASEDLKGWAIAMLGFIGISVAVAVVIQILFHIALAIGIAVKERQCEDKEVERIISSTVVEDERDKFISLKSSRIGYICAGIGFVIALVALAFGIASVVALHILFGIFAAGSIIEGIVSVYYYEKGVRNG
jgi:hypothetical protein